VFGGRGRTRFSLICRHYGASCCRALERMLALAKLKDKARFRCEARWRIVGHLAERSFRGRSWALGIMHASKVASLCVPVCWNRCAGAPKVAILIVGVNGRAVQQALLFGPDPASMSRTGSPAPPSPPLLLDHWRGEKQE